MKIKRFALGALWTNCYLIWDARGDGFVVDPGGPAEDVENFIRDNDIHIHWIVLTHGHADHIGGDIENEGRLIVIGGTAVDLGAFFTVAAGEQQCDGRSQFAFAHLLGNFHIGGVELPVAVGL